MTDQDWQEIEAAVEAQDPARTVAAYFAPPGHRRALIALAAFDRELARIGDTVREPMAGHVRLAWWREQVQAIAQGRKAASPVAQALAETARTYNLPPELIERTIDARAHDLDETPFEDEAALDAQADAAAGTIIRLAAHTLGSDAGEAARHAAIALTYAANFRALSANAKRRRYRLPLAWLREANANAEDAFAGTLTLEASQRIAARSAERIKQALTAATAARFDRKAAPALTPATLARITTAEISRTQTVARIALATLTRRL